MPNKVKFHTQNSRILLKLLPEFQTSLTGYAVYFGQKLSAKVGLNLKKEIWASSCELFSNNFIDFKIQLIFLSF